MDKSWMNLPRVTSQYENGVDSFLEFAFQHASTNGMIPCPCKKCGNAVMRKKEVVKEHLVVTGFIKGYTYWKAHGELSFTPKPSSNVNQPSSSVLHAPDDMEGLVHDVFGVPMDADFTGDSPLDGTEIPNAEAQKFYKLIDDSQQELYPGCKNFTTLAFIIRLLHLKCLGKWSNTVFTMLLDLLRDVLPEGVNLPKSFYEAEKLMKDLGLGYNKIDACPNDCMLYWGDRSELKCCKTCQETRWVTSVGDPDGSKRKIPHKSLWHFPLKPRLQRLFMSRKTAANMRWHDEGRLKDGCLRHPADSPVWKTFDHQNPQFAQDSRNVRLGLAADGFNPFKNMSTSHSTWPVILMPYNLPPWMSMKQPNFILSLLIPGPAAPGNDIDVYMEPLISELKELWDVGLETYDASRKQNFQMHAALMWTISDFPGYANLSGWSTKGKLACPVCQKHTSSLRLKNCQKNCYMGHRRFLDPNHHFRRNRQNFDGNQEHGRRPPSVTGSMILKELEGFEVKFGKKVVNNPKLLKWKKRSIFFELPYWKNNILRHNLDAMHIEKNVCESIWGTLLGIEGKTKDHYKSRLDLKEMGIRSDLHPIIKDSGKAYLPPSQFTLSKKEKGIFCKVLKKIKVPDGYSSNISRCVQLKPPRISGLKSHDNHILMQQLLPIALRKILPRSARKPLLKLSRYFRQLCSKEIWPRDVIQLEKDIAIILCEFETVFPPSFFDIMVHLTIHLATEVRLGGPVHYRWMYPIERYLSTLKSYVRNRSRPEGSIAEGYIADECLTFCSLYLSDYVETKFNRCGRNEQNDHEHYDGLDIFSSSGRAISKGVPTRFDDELLKKAHQYVLFNCDQVKPYIDQHFALLQEQHPQMSRHDLERIHSSTFASWFRSHVENWAVPDGDSVKKDLKLLAKGPNQIGLKYDRFIANGFRFHTMDVEQKRKTQNSGVMVCASTSSFSSRRDDNPIFSELAYYGILKSIIELEYRGDRRLVMFDCDWVSNGRRLKTDENGFTLVNFTDIRPHNEPFILASQASQVFYVEDPSENNWRVVIITTARSAYKMQSTIDVDQHLQGGNDMPDVGEGDSVVSSGAREGVRGVEVDAEEIQHQPLN